MEHSPTRFFNSEFLRLVAKEAANLLFFAAIETKSSSASEIAIQLDHIADHLSAQELYQLHPHTQDLSKEVLRDLFQISKWQTTSTEANRSRPEKTPLELYNGLVQVFKTEDSEAQVKGSITEFCKESRHTIEPYRLRVRKLGVHLAKNEELLKNNDTETDQYSHLRPLPVEVYPHQVHKLLVDGVKKHTCCVRPLHGSSRLKSSAMNHWHVTRLCLDSGYRSDDQLALFNIITATASMFYWQEMSINVQFKDSKTVESQSKATFDASELSLVECGDICRLLDSQYYAKLNFNLNTDLRLYKRPTPEALPSLISGGGVRLTELLRTRELTVAHKIQLSHAIARAFWQFYNSELMNTRWTSDDIIFIPLDQKHSQLDGIPLRPFVSFPGGYQCQKSPKECDDRGQFTHKYPRILYLGIMLLEIGLGDSLPLEDPTLSPIARVNTSHAKALLRLRDLEDLVWDGFPWKACFLQAVTHCLNPSHFNVASKSSASRRQTATNNVETSREDLEISDRREALYRKVVAPLSWLATAGFEKLEAVPLIPNRSSLRLEPTFFGDESIRSLWHKIQTFPSLHCSSSDNSKGGDNTGEFLDGLKVLAGYIARCRRHAKATNQIRVAILDTGCKKDLSFFQTTQRSARLKGWKDFTPGESESEKDEFGHGTFMAQLFLHVAPIVDIYLIRVAKTMTDLANSEENIAKAIEYAGIDPEWKVDVISMSFGLPYKPGKTSPIISEAIETVTKVRNGSVLFLASAGNSWEMGADFPARHEGVIPIYAADPSGRFLSSNPSHRGKGTDRLGTYGAGIPSFITEEIQKHFPTLDLRAGTSIATAIAAGIVSMTLSYASALPTLLGLKWAEKVCTKLYTKPGMEQMLLAMSLNVGDQNHFIHPVSFWSNKEEAAGFFASICAVVEQLND